MGNVLSCGNFSLDIKRVFLSFAQAYFARDESEFPWEQNFVQSRIIIADKYDIDLEVVEKKPAILLSRGAFSWANLTMGQKADPYFAKKLNPLLGVQRYSDLLTGQVTYNCIAKNGIVAERIANSIFIALTGFKQELRANGVHKIFRIDYGNEQPLKVNSDIDLTVVPVTVGFQTQKYIDSTKRWSQIDMYIDEEVNNYDSDFFLISGNHIRFYAPPANGTTLEAVYTEAVTLNDITVTPTGDVNGVNQDFWIPSYVHGYPLSADIIVSGYAVADPASFYV